TIASICYPAWTWAQSGISFLRGPQVRFLCGSYNHELSLTNSNLTRRLILSPWYQSLWGHRYKFREDQNTKTKFDTSAGGSRLATSVGGSLLGIGGDVLVIDDPHNVEQAESEAERKTVTGSFEAGLYAMAGCALISAIVTLIAVQAPRRRVEPTGLGVAAAGLGAAYEGGEGAGPCIVHAALSALHECRSGTSEASRPGQGEAAFRVQAVVEWETPH